MSDALTDLGEVLALVVLLFGTATTVLLFHYANHG